MNKPLNSELMDLIQRLYPICRSITGKGVRDTLSILSEFVSLQITEIPSGTQVFDWKIPYEWNIKSATIKNLNGEKIVDFKYHNLHVMSYSIPVSKTISRNELEQHLHSLPDHPEWIPYRTSYYDRNWGFCLQDSLRQSMTDEAYRVAIDSTLSPGFLTYGEFLIQGESEQEIVISTHICHPSLCNDNLSGVAIAALLAKELSAMSLPLSIRFLFIPGTIGSIAWLAKNEKRLNKIRHGMTLTCLGDSSELKWKRSRIGNAEIDVIANSELQKSQFPYQTFDFHPFGYDERQFNSPGFNLPFGSLMRGQHGEFPQYHTSADNLDLISPTKLEESYQIVRNILGALQSSKTYTRLSPFGEPQLGKRGLYRAVGGSNLPDLEAAMLWVANMSDGKHSLLDISLRSKIELSTIEKAATLLEEHAVIE